MITISFKLTMPNVGSWNGKWTGANNNYYIIKSVSNKYFKENIEKLFEGKQTNNFYYNFGDGWRANIELERIDCTEGRKRRKESKGFAGYDWMVDSIIKCGVIDHKTIDIDKINLYKK